MRMSLKLVIAGMAMAWCASRADAHALGIECTLKNDVVDVEAYYDDDTACGQARVHVERHDKSILESGKTDDQGRWSFARPEAGLYTVVVNDGAGHLARTKVTIPARGAPAAAPAATEEECPCHEDGSPVAATVSDGPSRQEFTRFPWRNLAIGLLAIGGGFLVSRRWLRRGAA